MHNVIVHINQDEKPKTQSVIESDSSTNREQFFFYITHFPFITFYYYDVVRDDAMHLINNHTTTTKNFSFMKRNAFTDFGFVCLCKLLQY